MNMNMQLEGESEPLQNHQANTPILENDLILKYTGVSKANIWYLLALTKWSSMDKSWAVFVIKSVF